MARLHASCSGIPAGGVLLLRHDHVMNLFESLIAIALFAGYSTLTLILSVGIAHLLVDLRGSHGCCCPHRLGLRRELGDGVAVWVEVVDSHCQPQWCHSLHVGCADIVHQDGHGRAPIPEAAPQQGMTQESGASPSMWSAAFCAAEAA